jgi:hypothetical protein
MVICETGRLPICFCHICRTRVSAGHRSLLGGGPHGTALLAPFLFPDAAAPMLLACIIFYNKKQHSACEQGKSTSSMMLFIWFHWCSPATCRFKISATVMHLLITEPMAVRTTVLCPAASDACLVSERCARARASGVLSFPLPFLSIPVLLLLLSSCPPLSPYPLPPLSRFLSLSPPLLPFSFHPHTWTGRAPFSSRRPFA